MHLPTNLARRRAQQVQQDDQRRCWRRTLVRNAKALLTRLVNQHVEPAVQARQAGAHRLTDPPQRQVRRSLPPSYEVAVRSVGPAHRASCPNPSATESLLAGATAMIHAKPSGLFLGSSSRGQSESEALDEECADDHPGRQLPPTAMTTMMMGSRPRTSSVRKPQHGSSERQREGDCRAAGGDQRSNGGRRRSGTTGSSARIRKRELAVAKKSLPVLTKYSKPIINTNKTSVGIY